MTYNIQMDNCHSATDSNSWFNRKSLVVSQICKYRPDVLAIQEGLYHQVKFLEDNLKEYNWVGVGRDDGDKSGEFMAIFFLYKSLRVSENLTFWLSTTPTTPGSRGWDAACNRIVTWAKFEIIKTKEKFMLFNTHLDHYGVVARLESAKLLVKRTRQYESRTPCVITGDFNCIPDSIPYNIITKNGWKDAFKISNSKPKGSIETFSDFNAGHGSNFGRIDYVFVNKYFNVLSYNTLSEPLGGIYPSDHLPVFVNVTACL